MADEKKILNPEQLEAIEYGEGPLLIIAGAGTGKTTVVTERIKYLITEKNISPSKILALTFTEKATREMETRVDEALPLSYANMWISTFHSFGDRILRDEALNIGLDPRYKLMTGAESVQLFRKNLFAFDLNYFRPLGNPTKFVDGILQHFSRLKDEDVEPNQYVDWAETQSAKLKTQNQKLKLKIENGEELEKYVELARAYQRYEELKIKEGLMDFGDLIGNVLKLFRARPKILSSYRNKFKYILIDEFQDTNYAQYALVKLLAPPPKSNLTVVADDNQCLPPDTKISLFDEEKRIDQIKVGDFVLTAVGKGHTSSSKVTKVFKNKKKTKLLTFTTETGEKITVTDNHKMFCYIPQRETKKDDYYVYLMKQRKYGWRLGITNDLASRLRLESHADGILAIGSYKNDQEARYYEALYSAKYGLPTVPFSPRERQAITGKYLDELFNNLNTERSANILALRLGLDLGSFSVTRGGVVRGETERVKVNFQMCYRNYRSKTHINGYICNPTALHAVSIETSSPAIIEKLEKSGYKLRKAKKGKKILITRSDLSEAWKIAEELCSLTDGIIDKKFAVGTENYQHKAACIMPASNIWPGNYLPVLEGKRIVYKKVVKREEEEKELFVYDLEVEKTHNFVANKIVVHNSIYRFRGAAVSNVLQFIKDYPKAKNTVLNKNYRSTQTILDDSYRLIKNNDPDTLEATMGISKKLQKMRGVEEEPVEFLMADRVENEAEKVAQKTKELTDNYSYKDFAILVRANSHADPFIKELARKGIPYQFLGPGMLFRQPEVKDLIAYLSVLYNYEDNVAMYRLLSMELFGISGRELATLVNFSKKLNLTLFEICEKIIAKNDDSDEFDKNLKKPEIGEKTLKTLANLVATIHRHMELVKKDTAGQILYYFLEDTGMIKTLTDYKTVKDERKVQNIAKFFDKLKTYEVEHEDASVYAVVDFINLSMELGESPLATDIDWTENDAVNILTVHSAKGLEFPVVFLVNLVSQRFPTTERKEQIPIPDSLIKEILPKGDYHLEEERRLFYVGMTRAKDRLFLTAANFYGEGKREKKISPFVVEALGDKIVQSLKFKVQSDQLSIFDFKPAAEAELLTSNLQLPTSVPITYLSYSQINTFNTCPLQYKYRCILRIPTPPSAALSFGDTIHQTMRDFYQRAIAGQNPAKQDLLEILDENWSPIGYPSKAHEEKYKKEGQKILSEFFEKSYNPKNLPLTLEQVFSVRINSNLKVGGRIDRIDRAELGIEIIDYKTGKSQTKKDVEKDLQMTLYALAAVDGTLTYMGILERIPKPEEIKISFYFFDNQEKISTFRKKEDFANLKEELLKKAQQISQSDFLPTPGKHCDFCEYKLICEAWS